MKNKTEDLNQNKHEFFKNGYSIIKNFLSPEDVENFKYMLVDGYGAILKENITLENISKVISKYENCTNFN